MIHVGNCLPWLRELEAKSVDHAITDPPYSEHVHANGQRPARKGERGAGKKTVARDLGFKSLDPKLQNAVARELARVVRRWVLVFCDMDLVPSWRRALTRAGLVYVRTLIWHKPNAAPQFSGDRPANNYEEIVLAHAKGRTRWNGGGRGSVYTHHVATGPTAKARIHTTEKPLPLLLELVRDFTDAGELVIDPFAGAGTTGRACVRSGRRFAGAELDAEMARLALERLEAETTDLSLTAKRARQVPMFDPATLVEAPRELRA